MHRPSCTSALLTFLVCAPLASRSPVIAQSLTSGGVHAGVIGGISYPGGVLKTFAKTDWNAGALVSIGTATAPLSVRFEGQWNQFDGKPQYAGDRPTEYNDYRIIDATANAVYTFPNRSLAKFYLIAGAGVYSTRLTTRLGSTATSTTATRNGVNGGAGVHLQVSRLATFVELRYHYIVNGGENVPLGYLGNGRGGLHFYPLTVGIVL